MGEGRVAFRVLVGMPGRKRPLGRSRHRWKDKIKMHLQEVGWGGGAMGWIDVAQGRDRWRTLVNEVMKLMFIGPCIIAIVEE